MIHNILRYGLMKRFRSGVTLSLALTFRCTLDCLYCTTKMVNGKFPVSEEATFEEWKIFINKFPYQIRDVHITGGSPELHPEFEKIVNWLLDKGIFVQVFTNLNRTDKLLLLNKTHRLMLLSTFHHSDKLDRFMENYNLLKKHYRINVDEINDRYYQRFVKSSRLKEFCTMDELKNNIKMLRISPDCKVFETCYELYKNYSVE